MAKALNPRVEKTRDFRKGVKWAHLDKEKAPARRHTWRQHRREVKALVCAVLRGAVDIDNLSIPPAPRTSGWETW